MSFWLTIFGLNKKSSADFDYYRFKHEIENGEEIRIFRQKCVDRDFDWDIRSKAEELFYDWVNAPLIEVGGKMYKNVGIQILNPVRGIYYIHHEATARHKDTNFEAEVRKLLDQMKKEYEEMFPNRAPDLWPALADEIEKQMKSTSGE